MDPTDLWELPQDKLTSSVTDAIEANFYSRCEPDKRPRFMQTESSTTSSEKEYVDTDKPHPTTLKSDTNKKKVKYDSSLFRALVKTFAWRIWWAGFFKLCGDTLRTTTPLVSKVLLTWLTNAYVYHRLSEEEKASGQFKQPKGLGYGIGLAFALFAMQEIASLLNNHYFQVSQANGLLLRTSLIGIVFRKSLRLSGRAKIEHSVGKITTMISADATRLDRFTNAGPNLWVSPIQIAIGIGLLLGILGYSALVGLGFILVKIMYAQRLKAVGITDKRIRLTTEVLQGIRLIKFNAWENFYIDKLGVLRSRELKAVRKATLARSVLLAIVIFIPILAAILSFITYALSGHDLSVAVIFSSLQLFNVIRQPLLMFPFVLSALTDALVGLRRISQYLIAEEMAEPYLIDYEQKTAVTVDADFTWETAGKLHGDRFGSSKKEAKGKKVKGKGTIASKAPAKAGPILPTSATPDSAIEKKEEEEKPFELKDLKFSVPKGSFVAIVGRVGSGKVQFGGDVAYVPQTAWIRNATLRENVLFGLDDDGDRFRDVIRACSLEPDLKMLPHAENTEIGEKGINLSGGQKARVSLARAAYSHSDVVLLDDPLSAVDAYVGKSILEQCILTGPLANRTRILVTHALHVLDKTDHIFVMDNGVITEQGTFDSLMSDSVVFSRLMEEYGSLQEAENDENKKRRKGDGDSGDASQKKSDTGLMQIEERNTGSVPWSVYGSYLQFAGGILWAPVLLFLLALLQGSA
ncbi:hypothetical protein H0H93_000601, partial [Arthromyces matolae]